MPIELDREEQRAWLVLLHAAQIGAAAVRELVTRHGSAAAALRSNEARLPDAARSSLSSPDEAAIAHSLRWLEAAENHFIAFTSEE